MEYFQKHKHRLIPSSPVIPYNDPTILFINAGMNQFKDIFTGQRKVNYSRATSCQKCIRVGGKHNDLDNVGFTARHHTFFEMLGNFSFGDYFKEEAIYYGWEWITKVLNMPKDRLYASVYEEDDEAFSLWEKIAPELKNGRILRFGKKDNYWSMGEVGPCGPSSEIHFDRGEKFGTGVNDVVNGENERFVEIGNLVFMQHDQLPDGNIIPLPKPSIDTGAGLERIAAIMQNVNSNYDIDIFGNLLQAISEITKYKKRGTTPSHLVIADHLRALTFAIADGAGISNEGQGYVLRRILRRASRHGRLLNTHEPFIYKLVSILVTEMGGVYPEIKEKQNHIENVIKAEEESFNRTLETGLSLFETIAKKCKSKVINGEDVFKLYDTYGFPYDLTEIMANEKGLTIDKDGFDKAMEQQRKQSRTKASFKNYSDLISNLPSRDGEIPATKFIRDSMITQSEVKKVELFKDLTYGHETVILILDKTPFYVESGGQISDSGRIYTDTLTVEVTKVYMHRDWYIHHGALLNGNIEDFKKGASVTAEVDADRRWDIMRNHTATHLSHAALRKVLGRHIKQSGSYVGPDRMRFDFSHHQPMTPDEISRVEEIVNNEILQGTPVSTEEMDIETAKKSGAMALFGEKYEDKVRVVSIGGFSKELCGGTHVDSINQIGPFIIALETGVASGVRRLEAITGREAVRYMLDAKKYRQKVAGIVGRPETDSLSGVEQLKEQLHNTQKELKKVKAEMFSKGSGSVGDEQKISSISYITHNFGKTDREIMAGWIDSQKAQDKPLVAVGLGNVNGKMTCMVASSRKAVDDFNINAGKISKDILPKFGGRGGGKPAFAQGTVANNTDAEDIYNSIKSLILKGVEGINE